MSWAVCCLSRLLGLHVQVVILGKWSRDKWNEFVEFYDWKVLNPEREPPGTYSSVESQIIQLHGVAGSVLNS